MFMKVRQLMFTIGVGISILVYASLVQAQDTWQFQEYAVGPNATGDANEAASAVSMSDPIQLPDGTYRMYYGVEQSSELPAGATTGIKSATSSDGITWTVESDFRLVGDSDGDTGVDLNEGWISGPSVVQLYDGTYRMYYQAATSEMTPPDFRVKSAISSDGLTWTREGTVIDIDYSNPSDGEFSLAGHCHVIRFADNDYVILLSGNYEKSNTEPSDLVIGTSDNGTTFSDFSVLYEEGHDPFVVRLSDGSGYRLFYGDLLTRQRSAFSEDGKTWPSESETAETILLDSDGSEVTEADTVVHPADRSALELSDEIYLFMSWGGGGENTTDIALMQYQAESDTSVSDTSESDTGNLWSCFIATAAFGSPLAKQVEILRRFRDGYLLTNSPGRRFVGWYYQKGPIGARFISQHLWAKHLTKITLYPVIAFAYLFLKGLFAPIILALAGACLWLEVRRRKLDKRQILRV
ncbi:MAG: CFI-box-CTERM domain-containing protein [Candidatus Omnitrophota bacterium]